MKNQRAMSSQTLVKLGLSPHESSVYQILLGEGSLSVKEISKKLEILPNALYRLLEKLIQKELISAIGKHPAKYRAISPSIAFESFTKRKMAEIETLKNKAINELVKKKVKAWPTQINLLIGRNEMMMTYVKMAKEAKEEILIISIGEPIPEEVLLTNRDAVENGIALKMIAHKYDEGNKNLLKSWQKMGWDIRHYPDWGFHLMVFDKKRSILSVNNPEDTRERTSMQIFSEGLSKALRDYFYSVWAKAKNI